MKWQVATCLWGWIVVGCHDPDQDAMTARIVGDPTRGAQIIRNVGCGSCHVIPGIREAKGRVAAPLTFFGERTYIAGQLPNTPDNLVRWILDPQAVEPGTAMPRLGLDETQARDVAAYLYTLH
jgi:cytochrome c2